MLSKSSIQFSLDGQGCVPSLLFDLRPNYGGGNEDNIDLLRKVLCTHCCIQCPWPCSRPLLTHTSARDSLDTHRQVWVSLLWVTAPFSWVLVHTSFVCVCVCVCVCVPSKSLFPQSCVKSVIKSHWPPKSNSLGVLSPFARSPGWEICCRSSSSSSVPALLCLTLCDTMEYSPLGSSAYGIFQARILEWVAISFSRESYWPRDRTCVSYIGRQILYWLSYNFLTSVTIYLV